MTIETVPPRLIELAADLVESGDLGSAIDPPPTNMDTAHTPCLFVFTGASQDEDEIGEDGIREHRIYRIQVAVMGEAEASPDLREARIRPLIRLVKNFYRSRPSLGNLIGVETASVLGDSGPVLLPEYEAKWIGFEIRLLVVERQLRTYAHGE